MKEVALFVMSCDKYSSVWYPYFELIKKYWPDHPEKIYLSTETKNYKHRNLDIKVLNGNKIEPWSQRLINALNQIDEEFIIFSLEDFFLLDYVHQDKIDECIEWMRNDVSIAECRLTTYDTVQEGEFYNNSNFRICPKYHGFRIDAQIAIWRKSFLLSVLNPLETPWQFEGFASHRSREREDKLLWLSPPNFERTDLKAMIVPYFNKPVDGYGIAWGKWLPNNKKWFEKNGIKGVKFHKLGALSEADVKRREKYLYITPNNKKEKIIKFIYQYFVYLDRITRGIFINGWADVKNTLCILKSRKLLNH